MNLRCFRQGSPVLHPVTSQSLHSSEHDCVHRTAQAFTPCNTNKLPGTQLRFQTIGCCETQGFVCLFLMYTQSALCYWNIIVELRKTKA